MTEENIGFTERALNAGYPLYLMHNNMRDKIRMSYHSNCRTVKLGYEIINDNFLVRKVYQELEEHHNECEKLLGKGILHIGGFTLTPELIDVDTFCPKHGILVNLYFEPTKVENTEEVKQTKDRFNLDIYG